MKIFYNSSMPRAGSTLLQNILGQNPLFYVTPTSGVLELIYGARNNFANSPEFKAQDKHIMEAAFTNFCKGGMESYFKSITDKEYIVDKSRGWGINYRFLNAIFPNPKVVCIVRDLRDIVSSMEKIHRKNDALNGNTMINHSEMKGTSVLKRADVWLNSQPVGLALERINELILQGLDKNILFIRYEDLLINPKGTMETVYNYLELPNYIHNFDYIEQVTDEDDKVFGMYGDHKIKNKLAKLKSDYSEVLGEEISQLIYNKHKWYFSYFNY